MSVKASAWAWAQKLSMTDKVVLLALADHSDDEGVCWPSQTKLAQKIGCRRQTVSESVNRLQKKGLIDIEARKVKGIQRSNKYTLKLGLMIIPCPPDGHGGVGETDTAMSVKPTLETSIEPSEEPSLSASAEGDMEKQFGKADVDAVLSQNAEKALTPTEALALAEKQPEAVSASLVRKVWVALYADQGFGYCHEWTLKQQGQAKLIAKRCYDLSWWKVLEFLFTNWSAFREYTGAYKPPQKPSVEFVLKFIGTACEGYVEHLQSVATPKKKAGKAKFK